MANSYTLLEKTIFQKVASVMTATGITLPLFLPNQAGAGEGGPFVRASVKPGSGVQAILGAVSYGELITGLLFVEVHGERHEGTSTVNDLADKLKTGLKHQALPDGNGKYVNLLTPLKIDVGERPDDQFYQVNVQVPFDYQT